MHFYRDSFGYLHPVADQRTLTPEPLAIAQPQIDWGKLIDFAAKGLLIGAGVLIAAELAKGLLPLLGPGRWVTERNTSRYILWDGRTLVQYGITNGPDDRCAEHLAAGKEFTRMEIVGPVVTRASARKWENGNIEGYRRRRGSRPKYNKVS